MYDSLVAISHYLPIFTTLISIYFAWAILSRYLTKRESKQLLWWGLGVATYGAGTITESLITLLGWNVLLFKAWYITGALLGGAPLAIGTVYLLSGRKAGNIAVTLLVTVVSITSIFVMLSPIEMSLVDPHIPNGKVLVWQSIRIVSPFINSFAALFLIGGAFYSAFRYLKNSSEKNRFVGNLLIAIGAILPGIGGFMSRIGHTEALYVGELIGIILIWFGYRLCQKRSAIGIHPLPTVVTSPETFQI
jgi:hypothetical protein